MLQVQCKNLELVVFVDKYACYNLAYELIKSLKIVNYLYVDMIFFLNSNLFTKLFLFSFYE